MGRKSPHFKANVWRCGTALRLQGRGLCSHPAFTHSRRNPTARRGNARESCQTHGLWEAGQPSSGCPTGWCRSGHTRQRVPSSDQICKRREAARFSFVSLGQNPQISNTNPNPRGHNHGTNKQQAFPPKGGKPEGSGHVLPRACWVEKLHTGAGSAPRRPPVTPATARFTDNRGKLGPSRQR